ncbi:ThiF family adenylyltransferase [Streptomyces sp. NBC_00059]|uniref:ThiF family adenylyltransferase n=1 Tax=Streptomyces sp. NBC_00059 TaxID=2975635 RepID=UPI002259F7DC|nr:ThiF family adenylyltransferase [Streptomyces sp. NBC_00059]MCX5413317.1 ThiF family adenylyltransferase [Streptomyces sp. NBC_00059]
MTLEHLGRTPADGESGPHSVFYEELVTRNAGVVPAREQSALRDATVLVAGCGSIGGAAVEPLTRLGVQRFVVADPGTFELNNLNRQSAVAADIEQNKAAGAAERIMSINPHARVSVFTEGVTPSTVQRLTAPSQLIIDGVDVTTLEGWRAKHLLHRVAVQRRLPLITGWDMAGTQYVRCYDYRRIREPFDGAVTVEDIECGDTWDLLRRAVPLRRVPGEMLAEIRANHLRPDYSFPQVAYTATAFGVLSSHMAVRMLAGRRVRQEISLDVHQLARPLGERWLTRLRWPFELAALVPPMIRVMRGTGAR